MHQEPKSDAEWTIHSLNIHGTFFQNKIASIVNNYNPNRLHFITSEYPVEYPLGNHREESRLDLLGYIPSQFKKNAGLYLIIECKKCNPEFVDWVFYPPLQEKLFQHDFSRCVMLRNCINLTASNTVDAYLDLSFSSRYSNDYFSDECRESRGKYEGVNKSQKTKTSNASITDASYQVTLATHYLAEENLKQNVNAIQKSWTPVSTVYIPIIVTTANLYVIEYDLQDIDISIGEIPVDKVSLKPINRVYYEYPVPPHLRTFTEVNYLYPNDFYKNDEYIRRQIIIVNANYFPDLLGWLINQAESFMSK